MRILMILDKKFPPDIRVEKEARSLIKAGNEVHLLSERGAKEPKYENIFGIHVHRLITLTSKKTFLYKLKQFKSLITHYDKVWAETIQKVINNSQIEALHIHDLPLVKTGVKVAQKNNILAIADLHENYPVALKVWLTLQNSKSIIKFISNKIQHTLVRWSTYEKNILPYCNQIIVVVPEAKSRIKKLGISSNKITVVSNTEDVDYFKSLKINPQLINTYKNDFIISYIGGFAPHRGIDTAIKAMSKVIKKIPNAKLLLVGGKNNDEYFRKLSAKLNLQNKIIFVGWQKFDAIGSYIHLSSICLVPHHKNPHTDTTIPHKLFQYMLMEKPVIVSNCKPLERIIMETNSGLIFEANNSSALAEAINKIYTNPNSYGINGYNSVIEKYNWNIDGQKLIELYDKIAKNR